MTAASDPHLPDAVTVTRRAAELLAGWGVTDATVVAVWNPRLRTSAGRAFWQQGRIELNPGLLGAHPAQLPQVLCHETAHVAAFRLHGARIRPHGREWRELMLAAGHRPEACHRMVVAGRRRRRYLYLRVCEPCGDRSISRAVRYGRCHRCGRAGRWLVLRAAAGNTGLQALRSLSLAEVRQRCIMAAPRP